MFAAILNKKWNAETKSKTALFESCWIEELKKKQGQNSFFRGKARSFAKLYRTISCKRKLTDFNAVLSFGKY